MQKYIENLFVLEFMVIKLRSYAVKKRCLLFTCVSLLVLYAVFIKFAVLKL